MLMVSISLGSPLLHPARSEKVKSWSCWRPVGSEIESSEYCDHYDDHDDDDDDEDDDDDFDGDDDDES